MLFRTHILHCSRSFYYFYSSINSTTFYSGRLMNFLLFNSISMICLLTCQLSKISLTLRIRILFFFLSCHYDFLQKILCEHFQMFDVCHEHLINYLIFDNCLIHSVYSLLNHVKYFWVNHGLSAFSTSILEEKLFLNQSNYCKIQLELL